VALWLCKASVCSRSDTLAVVADVASSASSIVKRACKHKHSV
jgi:hypothetical protein